MIDLLDFRKNIYSAEGEDGIIEQVFNILDIKNGFFCEFGAWDGINGSNTRVLLEKGWKGVYIESDPNRFQQCCENTKKFTNSVICYNKSISYINERDKLDTILKDTFLPFDFDLLSIDIDSCDYQIWDSLNDYKPKIVVIEIDSSHTDKVESVYNINKNTTTSFLSMQKLGNSKGYNLICSTGNMFFIRKDISFPQTKPYHQNLTYMNWRQ